MKFSQIIFYKLYTGDIFDEDGANYDNLYTEDNRQTNNSMFNDPDDNKITQNPYYGIDDENKDNSDKNIQAITVVDNVYYE